MYIYKETNRTGRTSATRIPTTVPTPLGSPPRPRYPSTPSLPRYPTWPLCPALVLLTWAPGPIEYAASGSLSNRGDLLAAHSMYDFIRCLCIAAPLTAPVLARLAGSHSTVYVPSGPPAAASNLSDMLPCLFSRPPRRTPAFPSPPCPCGLAPVQPVHPRTRSSLQDHPCTHKKRPATLR